MKRYHKKIYFPLEHKEKIKEVIKGLNIKEWQYSRHSIDKLYTQIYSSEEISKTLEYIKNLKFSVDNIFEYYFESNDIIKICFRVSFTENNDIILVVTRAKKLVTIYLNAKGDNHITLKKELYEKEKI